MDPDTTGHRPRTLQTLGIGLAALPVLGAVAVIALAIGGGQSGGSAGYEVTAISGDADFEVIIPPGASALAASGQDINFFPEGFTITVGETLRVRNADVGVAELGPFVVGPGETLTQTFTTPGVIEGYCSFTNEARTFFEVVDA